MVLNNVFHGNVLPGNRFHFSEWFIFMFYWVFAKLALVDLLRFQTNKPLEI